MKRLILALAAAASLAGPATSQTLTLLLPVISFPDSVVVPSTKGCGAQDTKPVCQLQE